MSTPFATELNAASKALQRVLQAVLDVEKRSHGLSSPLELVGAILTAEEWAWLRPLYSLIADINHALAGEPLPATEIAAIGAHARDLLSGSGAPGLPFIERYRALLQTHVDVAIAHGAAMQALGKLPPEPESEAERLHAHHQWNERRQHQRRQR
jgi:hypothetical protein